MAVTTNPSQQSLTLARESSHKPKRTSRWGHPLTTSAPAVTAQSQQKPEGAAASKHVANPKKPATKSKDTLAATTAPVTKKIPASSKSASVATKANIKNVPAASAKPRPQAPAPGSRFQLTPKENTTRPVERTAEQLAKEKAEQNAKFALAADRAKNFKINPALVDSIVNPNVPSALNGPPASSRYYLTAKKDTVRPAKQTWEEVKRAHEQQLARGTVEERTIRNKAKALADKTNTTASTKKRRSEAANYDDAPAPQKRCRTDGPQPARTFEKNAELNENAPAEARARPTRTTKATKMAEEKAATKPDFFWEASSDGEESELELVTKEEFVAQSDKKYENKRMIGFERNVKAEFTTPTTGPTAKKVVATKTSTKRARDDNDDEDVPLAPKKPKVAEPVTKKTAATKTSIKRARDDSDDDADKPPVPKKAKANAPTKQTSKDANTPVAAPAADGNASAATPSTNTPPPEPAATRKKGVAQFTSAKVRRTYEKAAKKRADEAAERLNAAAEREALRKAGHTVAKGGMDFLDM